MFNLPWSKAAKANRLMSKLSFQYHSLLCQPLSEFPEVADLQRESTQIELAKIAHTHYLLRREHIHSYPFSQPRLPLSPGVVIQTPASSLADTYYSLAAYVGPYAYDSSYASFFRRALANANHVHTTKRLASLSSELSHTFTNTDALSVSDYLTRRNSHSEYFYRGSLSLEDLQALAYHYRIDIVHLT